MEIYLAKKFMIVFIERDLLVKYSLKYTWAKRLILVFRDWTIDKV